MAEKIILDVDPGIDDAIAIIAAAGCPEAEILGVTTVGGNLPLHAATANATGLVRLLDLDVPVCPGAPTPLYSLLRAAEHFDGPRGLGGWELEPAWEMVGRQGGSEFIATTAALHPGQVTLVATAPLTNLAMALESFPEQTRCLKRVVSMGGAFSVSGNVTAAAEFNIYTDPDAAAIVLDSGLDITLVGLDVTSRFILPRNLLPRFEQGGDAARGVAAMARWFIDSHGSLSLHDPLALLAALKPHRFSCRRALVSVEVSGQVALGNTVADWRVAGNWANANIISAVDYDGCLNDLSCWILDA